jgi:hypothetical protein
MQPAEDAAIAHHSPRAIDVLLHGEEHLFAYRNLVGSEDLEALARLQLVPPLAQFVRRTRGRVQTIIELTIAGFNQGLLQSTLGKIAGQIIGRKGHGLRACQRHRRFAFFACGLGRSRLGVAWRGCATHPEQKADGGEIDSTQDSSTR